MKNKFFILFVILFSISIFAQEDQKQNPGVELPDFVITGKDVVSLKSAAKIEPGIIPVISPNYFKPAYSPEELNVKEISNPITKDVKLLDSLNYSNGHISFGAGIYTLPTADVDYAIPFNGGFFEAYVNGNNQLAYVDYSEKYNLLGGLNLFYTSDENAPFLPGTQVKIHGNYGNSAYKLYGSATPMIKRTYNNGTFSVNVINDYLNTFNFGLNLKNCLYSLTNENYTESLFDLNGFAKVPISSVTIGLDVNFKKQNLTNAERGTEYWISNYDSKSYYLKLRPKFSLNIADGLKATFGIDYSRTGGESFTSPYAAFAFGLSKNLSFFAEFNPDAKFLNSGYFLNQNPYFDAPNYVNYFYKKNVQTKLALKYEYGPYFQIDGGVQYYSSHNIPYYSDSLTSGIFNIKYADGKSISAFIDLLFHMGPYGVFYGTIKAFDTRNTDNNFIPYNTRADVTLAYSYYFDIGLNAKAELYFNSGSYTDINNMQKIDPFTDLRLYFKYGFAKNLYLTLSLSNLINSNNYIWKGYKEKPFDIVGGFKYKF